MNAVWQWLDDKGPVLALGLAAAVVLLVVLVVLLVLRLAEERDAARRAAAGSRRGPFRDGAVGSMAALRRAADLQASALEAIGVLAEQADYQRDRSTALALAIALGDFERVQAELDTALAAVPGERPAAAVDRVLGAARDFGVRIRLVEQGTRRPLRPGYEASISAVIREALQAIAQDSAQPAAIVRLDWLQTDLLVQIEQECTDQPGWQRERALGLLPSNEAEDFQTSAMRHHVERYGGIFVASRMPGGARLIRALFLGALGDPVPVLGLPSGRHAVAPMPRPASLDAASDVESALESETDTAAPLAQRLEA